MTNKLFTDDQIESILRSYKRIKNESIIIQEKLYDMFPSCVAAMGDGIRAQGTTSDQTQKYAIKNAETKDYLEAKIPLICGQVRVIDLAFDTLTSDCRDLVRYYYFERESRINAMEKLHFSRDQFGRYRRQSLDEINTFLSKTCMKPADFAM